MNPLRYRSIFLSDLHLGLRGCQADALLDFLQSTQCRQLYLVGDIVDIWAMQRCVYWPAAHNAVIHEVLEKARSGTAVTYVPGNHDGLLRGHLGVDFGNLAVRDEVVHETADGQRFLVVHGDRFDRMLLHGPWLARLAVFANGGVLTLSDQVSRVRRRFGLSYWSLTAFLKCQFKTAVGYIGAFQDAVAAEVRRRQVDGMICGHIHHADMRELQGVRYCNCGDWVENCTALVEHDDGRLELLRWTDTIPQTIADLGPALALMRMGATA
jgi:UDP-2,3-diacylglucosamine pyrophosphatase LpxH